MFRARTRPSSAEVRPPAHPPRVPQVSTPLTQKPGSSAIYSEPFGVVLVRWPLGALGAAGVHYAPDTCAACCVQLIGPWNFPASLILQPLISALAAGNVVIIKPSEVAFHTAALLQRIIPKCVHGVGGCLL